MSKDLEYIGFANAVLQVRRRILLNLDVLIFLTIGTACEPCFVLCIVYECCQGVLFCVSSILEIAGRKLARDRFSLNTPLLMALRSNYARFNGINNTTHVTELRTLGFLCSQVCLQRQPRPFFY